MKWNKELQDYFKSLNVEVTLYPSGTIKKFTSIERFHAYYSAELENWNKQGTHFNEIKVFNKGIIEIIDAANDKKNIEQARGHISAAVDLAKENIFPNLPSSSQLASFLIELSETNKNNILKFLFIYLKNPQGTNMSSHFNRGDNFNSLVKMLLIIEDNSKSNSRISSLVKLHEKFLVEAETDYKETKIELNDDIEISKQTNEQFIAEIAKWREDVQLNTDTFLNEKKEKLEELEKLYTEKLKLSKPAEYWETYSNKKRDSGRIWFGFSLGLGAIIVGFSTWLLIHLPGLIRVDNVLQWENLIRWSVLSALIYSSFFYILRLLVKMTLSSYHLASDAQERHQLTFQYLSLLQANAIEEKDREIILQSLFSRADTGLLKGDSGPTMPDGILSQIVKNIGG